VFDVTPVLDSDMRGAVAVKGVVYNPFFKYVLTPAPVMETADVVAFFDKTARLFSVTVLTVLIAPTKLAFIETEPRICTRLLSSVLSDIPTMLTAGKVSVRFMETSSKYSPGATYMTIPGSSTGIVDAGLVSASLIVLRGSVILPEAPVSPFVAT